MAVNSYTQPLFEFLKPWAACSRLKESNQHRNRSFLTEKLVKVTKDYLSGSLRGAAVVPGDLLSVTQMMQLSGPSVSAPVTRVDHTTAYERKPNESKICLIIGSMLPGWITHCCSCKTSSMWTRPGFPISPRWNSSPRKTAIPSPSTSQIASNFLPSSSALPPCVASLLNCNLTLFRSGTKT